MEAKHGRKWAFSPEHFRSRSDTFHGEGVGLTNATGSNEQKKRAPGTETRKGSYSQQGSLQPRKDRLASEEEEAE